MRAYVRFVIDGPTLTRLVASFALRMEFDNKTDHRQSFDEGREGVWGGAMGAPPAAEKAT